MDYSNYENKMPYPNKGDYIRFFIYRKGTTFLHNGTFDDLREEYRNVIGTPIPNSSHTIKSDLEKRGYVVEQVLDTELYNTKMIEYNLEATRVHTDFEHDLAVEYGVEDNPKRGLLFSRAWGIGHASGLEEVEIHYADLVDLIK